MGCSAIFQSFTPSILPACQLSPSLWINRSKRSFRKERRNSINHIRTPASSCQGAEYSTKGECGFARWSQQHLGLVLSHRSRGKARDGVVKMLKVSAGIRELEVGTPSTQAVKVAAGMGLEKRGGMRQLVCLLGSS